MNIVSSEQVPSESAMALQIMSAYLSNTNNSAQQLVELAHNALAAARVLLGSAASSDVPKQPAPSPASGAGVISSSARAQKAEKVVDLPPIPAESDPQDRATGYIRQGRQTLFDDRIICLDDGREVTFLLRHLRRNRIDLNDYFRRHDLPADYPTTTPAYVAAKRNAAAKSGFGKLLRPTREQRKRRGDDSDE